MVICKEHIAIHMLKITILKLLQHQEINSQAEKLVKNSITIKRDLHRVQAIRLQMKMGILLSKLEGVDCPQKKCYSSEF